MFFELGGMFTLARVMEIDVLFWSLLKEWLTYWQIDGNLKIKSLYTFFSLLCTSWNSLWISLKINQQQPTNSLSFFISILKMSGSSCPSSPRLFVSLHCFLSFCRRTWQCVERGNRCRRLLGQRKCSSPLRQDDKWIRGASVCVCVFVCRL